MATINGTSGNDTLTSNNSADTLNGEAGDDLLLGNGGNDRLFGGDDNDTLIGGSGNDSLSGGAGIDTADYSGSNQAVTVNLATGDGSRGDASGDTLTGIENVIGSGGNDSLTGDTLDNLLIGNNGNDTILGGGGADVLSGGIGNDSLFGGDGDDVLIGGSGNDRLEGGAGVDTADYSASTAGVTVNLTSGVGTNGDAGGDTLVGVENLTGSGFNDVLTGTTGNNSLTGGAGNDSLLGDAGDDTLAGGLGADTLNGGQGLDFIDYSASAAAVSINLATGATSGGDAAGDVLAGVDGIIGSAFNDTLIGFDNQGLTGDIYTNVFFGGAGNDSINLAGGNDSAFGGADNDTILGGTGNDVAEGGDGNDNLFGGDGADTLAGDDGSDSIDGGDGNDTISGGTGDDTLLGGLGNDTLVGGDGTDALFGGAGADSLSGGLGDDIIEGGDGNDTLLGGDGADTLIGGDGADLLVGGGGSDLIRGGVGDTIDGAESEADADTIDLTGNGNFLIVRDPLNPENGRVDFYSPEGVFTGSLTFTNIETIIACFTPGTLIETETGARAVETLRVGDGVVTRDNGLQTIRWIGRKTLDGDDLRGSIALQPILIRKGALGPGTPARDTMVSRQHRMLIEAVRAELLFGEPEVFVRALHLVGLPGVLAAMVPRVTYLHLMFDRHEVICADGAWSESFQPGPRSLGGLDADQQAEIFAVFPEMDTPVSDAAYTAARLTLKAHEARVLLAPRMPAVVAQPEPRRLAQAG